MILRPVASHFATHIPHDLGDPLLSATLLWWNAHTLPLSVHWWDGFFFAPAHGVVAFSDHRLGQSLIASPLIWLGASPVAAYNATLLLTFPLCAIAAHTLVFVVTRRHDAALVAGLMFGFSPYRIAHIEHLELLAAFGMPAALAALHLYLQQPRAIWLAAFGVALLVQALSCSYYFVFFLIMLALWLVWFIRRDSIDRLWPIGAVVAAVCAIVAPIALRYQTIHSTYGLARSFTEIVDLSADVTSLFTASPLLPFWRWTSGLNGPERQLFPGATLLVLVALGVALGLRRGGGASDHSPASRWLVAVSGVFVAVAVLTWVHGPWQIDVGPAALSASTTFKPLSLAAAALIVAVAASAAARRAFSRRSVFGFYLVAAGFLFFCSLGPKPEFLGRQFLYEPPYAWLMRIRLFGENVRVPARFGMPAIVALSVCAALGFAAIDRRRSRVVLAVIACAVAVESWTPDLPMVRPPAPWSAQAVAQRPAAVLELPMGETDRDTAAMYRAALAGVATVNGYSGYAPPHYEALRSAIAEHDDTALDALAERGPLTVTVDTQRTDGQRDFEWLIGSHRVQLIERSADRAWFAVQQPAPEPPPCAGPLLPIAAIRHDGAALPLGPVTDDDPRTHWTDGTPQTRGDSLEIDLGAAAPACAVRLSLGPHSGSFPRLLAIATSLDGRAWSVAFVSAGGGSAVRAALENPRTTPMTFPLPGSATRFVRLTVGASHPTASWVITELAVVGSPPE